MPRENSFGGDRGVDRRPSGFGGRQMGDRRSRFDRRWELIEFKLDTNMTMGIYLFIYMHTCMVPLDTL